MRSIYKAAIIFGATLASGGCLDLKLGALSGPVGTYTLDKASMEKAIYTIAEAQLEPMLRLQPEERQAEIREEFLRSLEERKVEIRRDLEGTDLQLTLAEDGTWTRLAKDGKTADQLDSGAWELREETLVLTIRQKNGNTLADPTVEEASYRPGEIVYRAPELSLEVVLRRM